MTLDTMTISEYKRKRSPAPTEHHEQAELFRLAMLHSRRCPALRMLYAIPNGANKSRAARAKFQREGLRAGIPDLQLAAARGGYHGLYIEMKRAKGGVLSLEQLAWHEALRAEGYRVEVCRGADAAWGVLCDYLGITNEKEI